ncbi:hypothetical protein IT402_02500 [Candidatus Nomurabacteria bacterium]|nr:hypothetical protein [Candidatus Nomurabacteria bacterium]
MFPVNAFADYRTGYQDFICLFTPTERNCDHSSPESAVKRAEKSGLAYGKTVKDGITSTGIKKIILQLGFSLNPDKDIRDGSNSESRYFYKRVADPRSNSFFVRLKYTPGLNGEAVSYQFSPIAYSIYNNSVATGNFTITDDTIKGDAYTSGQLTSIAFYKERSGGDLMISQSVVSKEITFDSEIVFNSTRKIEADLWYCGGESTSGENVDGRYSPRDGIRVEYFTTDGKYEYKNDPNDSNKIDGDHGIEYPFNLCDKEAAYKIGETIDLSSKLPKTQEAANIDAEQNINSGVVSTAYTGSVMPQCHILNGWGPGSGSFMACISNVFYYLVFKPIAWLAWLLGQIFDFFIGYSLSDESYRHNFVQTGWQLVRDISNIFFIIIMIYSGLAAVFSTSNVSYKKVIPTLIINALIINFSLFATRIVIDMSNITARLFYNQIEVCQKDDFGECVSDSGPGGFKPISESIISSFNPQKIIQNANLLNTPSAPEFNPDAATDGSQGDFNSAQNINGNFNNNPGDGSLNTEGLSRSDTEYAAYFGLIALIMAMIAFGTAMMFWKTAFMFVGRVIGLYVAMIFSPFAFLSRGNVPLVSKIPTLNYGSWWKDLTNYALLAPIFVFFLYIISAFLKADFINGLGLNQNTSNFFEAALYVVIPMLIIYGLISQGVGIAKNLAGKYGEMVQNFATKATGLVGGAAIGVTSGGLAYAGSRFGSRVGRYLGRTRLGRRAAIDVGRAASNGTRASRSSRLINRALNWTQNSSWDARNTRLGQLAQNNAVYNQMGISTKDKLSNLLGLGTKDTDGGYIGRQERRQKELKDEIENIKFSYLNDEQSKKLWKEISDAKIGNDTMKDYLNKTDASFKASSDKEKQLKEDVKKSQKKIDDLEADLKTTNKLSDKEMEQAKKDLIAEKKSLTKSQSEMKDIQKLQLQTIEEINEDKTKRDKIRETDEYKKSYKEKTDDLKKTYGKVEGTKDLTNAIRRDYAETLRNDSFWMKDGKQRKWLWTLGGLGGGSLGAQFGAGLGLLGAGISGAFGSVMAERIKFEQEALDAVTKKYIKDYSKGKGKTSKIDQYRNNLDSLNQKLKEAIALATGKTAADINIDDHDLDKQKEYVKSRVEQLRAEMDFQDTKFKDISDKYKRGAATEAEVKAASVDRKRAKDNHDEYENLWKNRADTENNIKKEEEKESK